MTTASKPEWARKLDNLGERFNSSPKNKRKNRTIEYIVAIVINIVLIAIWGRLPQWLPFITDSFAAVLPLFYISFAATIAANMLFLVYDEVLFKATIKAALNILSIVVLITLDYVFPFDFSAYPGSEWEIVARIVLVVSIIGTVIGTVVESLQILFGPEKSS
ncbi:MAG: hypothetical protein WCT32_04085 [Patescibacteria group bacterium]|jgi:hypothetical protein